MAASWRVGALGLVAGGIIGGAAGFQLAGRPVSPPPTAADNPAPDETGPVPRPGDAVERAAVFHRWWRRPLGTEDVVDIVRLVGDGWPGTALLIRKDAGLEPHPRADAEADAPPGCLWLRLDGDHKPNRAEVLEALRAAMDQALSDPR